MIKLLIKEVACRCGYAVVKLPSGYRERGYALYDYTGPDGTFDYARYRQIQIDGNKRKLDRVWAIEENIHFLAHYILERNPRPEFGICHGTRRGLEQQWFSSVLQCPVIGTEISDTATQFPNTIQWDFHQVKPEWLGSVDFIYSNSFDHSYDPETCLNAWMSCLKPGGVCILERGDSDGVLHSNRLDPFGAELMHMPYLIARWGKGAYVVREILDAVAKPSTVRELSFFVLENFPRH